MGSCQRGTSPWAYAAAVAVEVQLGGGGWWHLRFITLAGGAWSEARRAWSPYPEPHCDSGQPVSQLRTPLEINNHHSLIVEKKRFPIYSITGQPDFFSPFPLFHPFSSTVEQDLLAGWLCGRLWNLSLLFLFGSLFEMHRELFWLTSERCGLFVFYLSECFAGLLAVAL